MEGGTMNIADVLEHFYTERGARRYETAGPQGRSGVTQLQHALQCATLAARAEAPDPLVAAALLHDLGHLLYEQADHEMGTGKDDVHQYLALPFLRPYFGPAVLEPIKFHVDAKRWLCATDPAYWAALSAGSQRSLVLQGGPFSADAALAFIAQPYAEDAVRLRRWDDRAKDPAHDVRPFSAWRDLLERVAARPWPPPTHRSVAPHPVHQPHSTPPP
jgi:phosphonate degradation associated HDIG domain protein